MKPDFLLLNGIVHRDTLIRITQGHRLKQASAYKRIARQLYREMGKNEMTDSILEAIKPKPK